MLDLKKMSKALIPLSLITMTSAFADSEIANNCCPTPCCVPQPKACIDCECYNHAFYDLQCDWGVFVSADFLRWYARETNLQFADRSLLINFPMPSPDGIVQFAVGEPVENHYLKSKWKPGFRVGIGMNSACDGWDIYANYTWFESKTSGSTSISVQDFLFDIGDVPLDGVIPPVQRISLPWIEGGINALTIGANWRLQFNQIDLELGRKYWVSKCMTVRPFIGLRGAWTRTTFNDRATSAATNSCTDEEQGTLCIVGPPAVDSIQQKNKLRGVGLLGGLQPTFYLGNWCGCGEFSIYGNVDGALLWGRYSSDATQVRVGRLTGILNDVPVQNTVQDFTVVRTNRFTRMQGILDLGIGLRWEEYWCCDRYMTSIDLGWEHHYWWDFGLYHKIAILAGDDLDEDNRTIEFTPGNSIDNPTNLGFGGLVVRFRFDF